MTETSPRLSAAWRAVVVVLLVALVVGLLLVRIEGEAARHTEEERHRDERCRQLNVAILNEQEVHNIIVRSPVDFQREQGIEPSAELLAWQAFLIERIETVQAGDLLDCDRDGRPGTPSDFPPADGD